MPEQNTTQGATETAAQAIDPIYVHLVITDPEVAAAVGEYQGAQRNDFVATCLKIGVLSLRAAKGVVDGDAIRTAGTHLIDQLSERLTGYRTSLEQEVNSALRQYFDPKSGLFQVRVENLVKPDGDLARVIAGQVTAAQQNLDKVLERFIGENSPLLALLSPGEGNRLLEAMRRTVSDVTTAEHKIIVSQFSLDDENSALSRLIRELNTSHGELTGALKNQVNEVVQEFSLDKPDSALSRLVGRVEAAQKAISSEFTLDSEHSALSRLQKNVQGQLDEMARAQTSFHTEVMGLLSSMNARKESERKSTLHGAEFEEAVGDRLHAIGGPAGDIVVACGTTTGTVRASKIGDYVVTLPPESAAAGAKIVVEAKESRAYDVRATLDECDEARRNRGAGVCLFVHSAATAPAGLEVLTKFGNDVVIVWDKDDARSDVVFRAGYLTAKALSLRAAQRSKEEAASFQAMDKAIEVIRKQLTGFQELKTTGETILNGSNRILDRVRIMGTELEKQVGILSDQVSGLKDEAGEA
jgi:hypothetical protein